jgi:hypothetical protein
VSRLVFCFLSHTHPLAPGPVPLARCWCAEPDGSARRTLQPLSRLALGASPCAPSQPQSSRVKSALHVLEWLCRMAGVGQLVGFGLATPASAAVATRPQHTTLAASRCARACPSQSKQGASRELFAAAIAGCARGGTAAAVSWVRAHCAPAATAHTEPQQLLIHELFGRLRRLPVAAWPGALQQLRTARGAAADGSRSQTCQPSKLSRHRAFFKVLLPAVAGQASRSARADGRVARAVLPARSPPTGTRIARNSQRFSSSPHGLSRALEKLRARSAATRHGNAAGRHQEHRGPRDRPPRSLRPGGGAPGPRNAA